MPNLYSSQFKYANDPILEEIQNTFFKSKPDIVNNVLPQLKEILNLYDDEIKKTKIEMLAKELGVSASDLKKYLK
jgi:hypothetical protein